MKLLVCGSEGRILSKVIPRLLDAGHEVTGVDNCHKWGRRNLSRPYRFVLGDCADPRVLAPLMPGVDGVIQGVATLYGVIGFHEHAADTLINDIDAHQAVIHQAAENHVSRVVFLSSSMVYEQSRHEPHRENDTESAGIPRTDYGLSKLVNERISQTYFQHRGLSYTIWRPFNIIDPGEEAASTAGYSHVFADTMDRLVVRGQNPLDVLGDGLQVRSFLHIKEAAEAIARFSFDPRTRNQTYNLGRDECVTVRELAARIYRKAVKRGLVRDKGPLQFRPTPVIETDVKRRVGSFEKIARETGWKSEICLDSSLDDCLDALATRLAVNAEAAR